MVHTPIPVIQRVISGNLLLDHLEHLVFEKVRNRHAQHLFDKRENTRTQSDPQLDSQDQFKFQFLNHRFINQVGDAVYLFYENQKQGKPEGEPHISPNAAKAKAGKDKVGKDKETGSTGSTGSSFAQIVLRQMDRHIFNQTFRANSSGSCNVTRPWEQMQWIAVLFVLFQGRKGITPVQKDLIRACHERLGRNIQDHPVLWSHATSLFLETAASSTSSTHVGLNGFNEEVYESVPGLWEWDDRELQSKQEPARRDLKFRIELFFCLISALHELAQFRGGTWSPRGAIINTNMPLLVSPVFALHDFMRLGCPRATLSRKWLHVSDRSRIPSRRAAQGDIVLFVGPLFSHCKRLKTWVNRPGAGWEGLGKTPQGLYLDKRRDNLWIIELFIERVDCHKVRVNPRTGRCSWTSGFANMDELDWLLQKCLPRLQLERTRRFLARYEQAARYCADWAADEFFLHGHMRWIHNLHSTDLVPANKACCPNWGWWCYEFWKWFAARVFEHYRVDHLLTQVFGEPERGTILVPNNTLPNPEWFGFQFQRHTESGWLPQSLTLGWVHTSVYVGSDGNTVITLVNGSNGRRLGTVELWNGQVHHAVTESARLIKSAHNGWRGWKGGYLDLGRKRPCLVALYIPSTALIAPEFTAAKMRTNWAVPELVIPLPTYIPLCARCERMGVMRVWSNWWCMDHWQGLGLVRQLNEELQFPDSISDLVVEYLCEELWTVSVPPQKWTESDSGEIDIDEDLTNDLTSDLRLGGQQQQHQQQQQEQKQKETKQTGEEKQDQKEEFKIAYSAVTGHEYQVGVEMRIPDEKFSLKPGNCNKEGVYFFWTPHDAVQYCFNDLFLSNIPFSLPPEVKRTRADSKADKNPNYENKLDRALLVQKIRHLNPTLEEWALVEDMSDTQLQTHLELLTKQNLDLETKRATRDEKEKHHDTGITGDQWALDSGDPAAFREALKQLGDEQEKLRAELTEWEWTDGDRSFQPDEKSGERKHSGTYSGTENEKDAKDEKDEMDEKDKDKFQQEKKHVAEEKKEKRDKRDRNKSLSFLDRVASVLGFRDHTSSSSSSVASSSSATFSSSSSSTTANSSSVQHLAKASGLPAHGYVMSKF